MITMLIRRGIGVAWVLTMLLLQSNVSNAQTYTFDSGNTFWDVPAGVKAIQIEVWGGGGSGGSRTGSNGRSGGGGGGAYSRSVIAVIPGQRFYYSVGAGAAGGATTPGGSSWFSAENNSNNPVALSVGGNSVAANSNNGVAGGLASAGFGDFRTSGGAGGTSTGSITGGGGGAGGSSANGGNASGGTAGAGGASGGGAGAAGNNSGTINGASGIVPGGGGAGARRNGGTDRIGGVGASGRVRITVIPVVNNNQAIEYLCARPGKDGSTVTTYGTSNAVNTYYPVTSSVSAGATSMILAAVPTGYGGAGIVAGDLLIVIQMQRAGINTNNNGSYGMVGEDFYTGRYEYVVAANSVAPSGGSRVLQFTGAGPGNGLKHAYQHFDGTADDNRGRSRFQVIRIPQYKSVTLGSSISAPVWNGAVGGVVAFEVAGMLNLNGQTIHANAKGFRGGARPPASTSSPNLQDYRNIDFNDLGSSKGEGITGTPRYIRVDGQPSDRFDHGTAHQGGYGHGDYQRGAPGNAGGGGNSHNGGGGGGSNGGAGGMGGFGYRSGWSVSSHTTATDDRGIGARSLAVLDAGVINATTNRLFFGGGGGAGDANNTNQQGHGGIGGGIVLITAVRISGTGTLQANGSNGINATDDGAGGGGAGGTILLNVKQNSVGANITINANGGSGGNVTHADIHGPGGGGSGGVVFYRVSGASVTSTAIGGIAGTHSSWSNHSASSGSGGNTQNFVVMPPDLDRREALGCAVRVITNPMLRSRARSEE